MHVIKRKNEISIERLQLCEQYFLLMRNVEALLFDCHLNIAKTRKILDIPVSFDAALSISDDKTEIELYSGDEAQNDYDVFSLNGSKKTPSTDPTRRRPPNITETAENEAASNKTEYQKLGRIASNFRPFGILEPQSARIARKNIQSIFPLLCDAANIRYKVLALDQEMIRLTI
ncbi:unnamed protein product [Meloidogyne enterolobii]|uniref:Uncharacterized protein n=1 Tax=Meloidogyne enterolobii TaxID=390850 RepID=A0ACB1A0Y7_MELEN